MMLSYVRCLPWFAVVGSAALGARKALSMLCAPLGVHGRVTKLVFV